MAIISKMKKLNDGSFAGQLQTPFLNHDLKLEPINENKTDEKQPDFRAQVSDLEAGAGWSKVSKKDKQYISVTIDCPSLPAPIYANLHEVDGVYNLIWSR